MQAESIAPGRIQHFVLYLFLLLTLPMQRAGPERADEIQRGGFSFPDPGFTQDREHWGFADLYRLTRCGPRTLKEYAGWNGPHRLQRTTMAGAGHPPHGACGLAVESAAGLRPAAVALNRSSRRCQSSRWPLAPQLREATIRRYPSSRRALPAAIGWPTAEPVTTFAVVGVPCTSRCTGLYLGRPPTR